jgi:hypothetical protein
MGHKHEEHKDDSNYEGEGEKCEGRNNGHDENDVMKWSKSNVK